MEKLGVQDFKVGQLAEIKTLEEGFRGSWFRCKYEVEPKSCPGFIFRRSILLDSTDMSPTEFRSFMEHLSNKYYGNTYRLIAKNCNHFTNEVSMRLTGKPIPGWVNHLAKLRSFCNCLLPKNIQLAAVRHLPDHATIPVLGTDEDSDSGDSSLTIGSEEDEVDNHHLLEPALNFTSMILIKIYGIPSRKESTSTALYTHDWQCFSNRGS
ncbi:hypothetical protein L2E82_36739 [Cichorium intybus]|uniref:Uncharacterized protein n=1 Tax=Cichorium intybus TaxID=13427 RepID=A0ACB9ADS6_CICIN|nr:hypothetical protein L2E82_36739 [Cichorium intybus]